MVEEKLSEYIKTNGITLFSIIRRTGIGKTAIYSSLGENGKRKLRADEYIKICSVIGVDPMYFVPEDKDFKSGKIKSPLRAGQKEK